MGNSQPESYSKLDESFQQQLENAEAKTEKIMKHYAYFDNRNDHRFGQITLYKSIGDIIVARFNQSFSDFKCFSDFAEMYERRQQINSKSLLKIKNLIKQKEYDYKGDQFIISLFIDYPYNDLKNEIAYRKVKKLDFTERELIKILKAGVETLYRLKNASFNYTFALDQHSICLFIKPHSETFRVKILEFDIMSTTCPEFELTDDKIEDHYRSNCKYLALAIIEASFMINEMMMYRNTTDFILFRIIDEFQTEYDDPDLCNIVEGFLKEKMTIEEAYDILNKRKRHSERYIYVDNKILKNDDVNKRGSRRKSLVQDLMNSDLIRSIRE